MAQRLSYLVESGASFCGLLGAPVIDRTFVVPTAKTNFQLGTIYSMATAALLATQEPFAALAAKRLPPLSFVCLTQTALLLSVPVLTATARSCHDFSALLFTPRNLGKLGILFRSALPVFCSTIRGFETRIRSSLRQY